MNWRKKSKKDWGRLDLNSNKSSKWAISDFVEIIGGGTPKTSISEYWNGSIPWLSVKDFGNDDRYVFETEKTITNEGLNNSSTKLLQKDDIIISARGTVGELAMLPFPMAFNQSCYGIRPKDDSIDKTFLYYLLRNSVQLLRKNTHGSVFDTITRDTFKGIEVEVPSIEEQVKIAGILSSLDDKIAENKKINHHLLEQAIAIHKYFCVELVDDTFVTETVKSISNEVVTGKTPSTKIKEYYGGSLPFITIPDMHGNVFCVETARYLTNVGEQSQQRKTLPAKSIAVSCIATPGLVCLLDRPSQTNQQINSVIPKENQEYYLFLELLSKSQLIIELGSSGSTTYNLNKTQFEKIEILAPPIEKRGQINQMLSPLFDELNHIQHENNRLIELRDTLLPKLMSGELSVSQAAK